MSTNHVDHAQAARIAQARAEKANRLLDAIERHLTLMEARVVRWSASADDAALILACAEALDAAQWATLAELSKIRPPSPATIEQVLRRARARLTIMETADNPQRKEHP